MAVVPPVRVAASLRGPQKGAAAAVPSTSLPAPLLLQVKRSQENPLGYSDDELTKRIIDLKEW